MIQAKTAKKKAEDGSLGTFIFNGFNGFSIGLIVILLQEFTVSDLISAPISTSIFSL